MRAAHELEARGKCEKLERMNVEWRFLLQVAELPLTSVNAPRIPTAKKPLVSAWTSVLLETGPAVDGPALGWLERNFRLLFTIGAGRFMHLAFEALSICHFISSIFSDTNSKTAELFSRGAS